LKVKQNNICSMLSSASHSRFREQFRSTPQQPEIQIILRTTYPRWNTCVPIIWNTTQHVDAQHLLSLPVSCNTKGTQAPTRHGSNYAQSHHNAVHRGDSVVVSKINSLSLPVHSQRVGRVHPRQAQGHFLLVPPEQELVPLVVWASKRRERWLP